MTFQIPSDTSDAKRTAISGLFGPDKWDHSDRRRLPGPRKTTIPCRSPRSQCSRLLVGLNGERQERIRGLRSPSRVGSCFGGLTIAAFGGRNPAAEYPVVSPRSAPKILARWPDVRERPRKWVIRVKSPLIV